MLTKKVKSKIYWNIRKPCLWRRGTAEIVGSVMFLLIIFFFFTNVFLWHDNATREMDGVLSEKMNSIVSIEVENLNVTEGLRLKVTNNGGVSVELSRLWIIAYLEGGLEDHSFEDIAAWIAPGKSHSIQLYEEDIQHLGQVLGCLDRVLSDKSEQFVHGCSPVSPALRAGCGSLGELALPLLRLARRARPTFAAARPGTPCRGLAKA